MRSAPGQQRKVQQPRHLEMRYPRQRKCRVSSPSCHHKLLRDLGSIIDEDHPGKIHINGDEDDSGLFKFGSRLTARANY